MTATHVCQFDHIVVIAGGFIIWDLVTIVMEILPKATERRNRNQGLDRGDDSTCSSVSDGNLHLSQ